MRKETIIPSLTIRSSKRSKSILITPFFGILIYSPEEANRLQTTPLLLAFIILFFSKMRNQKERSIVALSDRILIQGGFGHAAIARGAFQRLFFVQTLPDIIENMLPFRKRAKGVFSFFRTRHDEHVFPPLFAG